MILRLATSAAIHTAGGVVFGVTAALAACTLAQAARHMAERQGPSAAGPEAYAPPRTPPDIDPAA